MEKLLKIIFCIFFIVILIKILLRVLLKKKNVLDNGQTINNITRVTIENIIKSGFKKLFHSVLCKNNSNFSGC